MCQTALIDGEEIDDMQSLADLIGAGNIVISPLYPTYSHQPGCCLCPADLNATAEALGKRAAWPDDLMEVRFE